MRLIIAAMLLACAPVAAQAAENFTFTGTTKGVDGVRVPATGQDFSGAQIFTNSVVTTYADGHKDTQAGKCSAWRNPPGAQFTQTGVCVVKDLYELNYSCQAVAAKPQNCWGLLNGTGGAYKGRTAVIAYTAGQTLDGAGRWSD